MVSPAPNSPRTPENSGSAPSAAATPAGGNRSAVELTAVTTRDDFLLELGEALAGQASVRPVETMAAALEHLSGARKAQVLVIDARDVSELRAELDRAQTQSQGVPVLVFAPVESEKQVAADLKGAHAFAVLPIPVDARKTAAVIEGAIAEAAARKATRGNERSTGPEGTARSDNLSSAAASGHPTIHASAGSSVAGRHPISIGVASTGAPARPQSGSKTPPPPSSQGRRIAIGVGVGVAAIAAAAVFFLNRGADKASAPAGPAHTTATAAQIAKSVSEETSPPPTDTLLLKGKVDELLEKARLAMRERRYSEPAGDNALLYYRSAAAAEAANGEAADGMQRIAGVLASRFDEAVGAGRLDEASQALSNFRLAAPSDPRANSFEVRLLSAWITKAFNEGNFDRATVLIRQASQSPAISADQVAKWRTELARHQEDIKVQRIAGLVSDRLRDGRLIEPADDSAKTYVQQLNESAPNNAVTLRLEKELGAAYLRRAREAALANHPAEQDRWLTEARAIGVSTGDITALQREVASSRVKATAAESDRLAQLVRDRSRDGKLSDPAQDSATFYLTQLQGSDPNNAAMAQLSHDLAARFLDRARSEAQASGQATQLDADLAQAKHWGADPKDIQSIQALASTAGAQAANPAVNLAALGNSLKKTRSTPPEYPSRALEEKVSGSVTVEFTVTTSGDARDIHVVNSTPAGVFDRAAINAVKRWHWESPPVEIPMRTAIRFELPK